MASARCLLSFCSLVRSFSMSHCRSSTVVSISDTLVSELVTLSTNSLYCNEGKDMHQMTIHQKQRLQTHKHSYTHRHRYKYSPHTVPRTSYLHGHLVVSALQESGQVSQTTVLIQESVVHIDDFRLAIFLTCCQRTSRQLVPN